VEEAEEEEEEEEELEEEAEAEKEEEKAALRVGANDHVRLPVFWRFCEGSVMFAAKCQPFVYFYNYDGCVCDDECLECKNV